MKQNHSPWLAQLNRLHEINLLEEDRQTDIAIVGAGIAGLSTTYFLLKNTNKKIYLIESNKVAHGATGHNAGQVVSYIERQISGLVSEFGIEQTAKAQQSIDSAWELLKEIFEETKLEVALSQFIGHAGCQDLEEVLIHLENSKYAKATHVKIEPMMIAQDSEVAKQIPEKYQGLYSLAPHEDILSILETDDPKYIAAISSRKGVMNSALFCQELLEYIFKNYPDRFSLFEESHVTEVELHQNKAVLKIRQNTVTADKVILCTNGFEKFNIKNLAGEDINTNFHHLVNGAVGYMAAYVEDDTNTPTAISYLHGDNNPYFYLTRRNFENENNEKDCLICIGGPESKMDDSNSYSPEHPYPQEALATIDGFLHHTYKHAPEDEINYKYRWHGLMGYTPNGVRLIGPEPINPVLLYNLGCNGVGILPSIYGGKRISQIINGEALEKSIFDPQDSRQK